MKWKRIAGIIGLAAVLAAAAGCAGTKKTKNEEKRTENTTDARSEEPAETDTENAPDASSDVPVLISGTILTVSEDSVTVDNESEHSSAGEIVLRIDPENTRIVDGRTGLPADTADTEGTEFAAYLGQAMTMSIPPQTTPFVVIVNLPEGEPAPQYVTAAEDIAQEGDGFTLRGTDGSVLEIPATAEIKPFRTRNLVTAQDITAGRELLIWTDAQGQVTQAVLFEN